VILKNADKVDSIIQKLVIMKWFVIKIIMNT
jgi:hypothetical protein